MSYKYIVECAVIVELSKEQQQLVDATEKRILVLAPPGSGKTTALTEKIKALTESVNTNRIDVDKILVLSFNKGITKELKQDIQKTCDPAPKVQTINSLSLELFKKNRKDIEEMLKEELNLVHVPRLPNEVLDKNKNKKMLELSSVKKLYQQIHRDTTKVTSLEEEQQKIIGRNFIARLFNDTVALEFFKEHWSSSRHYSLVAHNKDKFGMKQNYLFSCPEKAMVEFIRDYVKESLEKELIFSADVEFYLALLFCQSKNKEQTTAYFKGFKNIQYLFIDECQDISKIQVFILKRFIEHAGQPSLILLGDDDQTLYNFRSASQENIIDLARFHPNNTAYHPRIIEFQTSTRSHKLIMELGDNIVNKCTVRLRGKSTTSPENKTEAKKDLKTNGVVTTTSIICADKASREEAMQLFLEQQVEKILELEFQRHLESSSHEDQKKPIIAILARNNDTWENIKRQLENKIKQLGKGFEKREKRLGVVPEFQRPKGVFKPIVFSTIHKSKGKGFKNVFILGPDNDHWTCRDEERRLLYVGITRAKENLHFVCVRSATTSPHPFLIEMEMFLLEEQKKQHSLKGSAMINKISTKYLNNLAP